jgi:hypothetical protein
MDTAEIVVSDDGFTAPAHHASLGARPETDLESPYQNALAISIEKACSKRPVTGSRHPNRGGPNTRLAIIPTFVLQESIKLTKVELIVKGGKIHMISKAVIII